MILGDRRRFSTLLGSTQTHACHTPEKEAAGEDGDDGESRAELPAQLRAANFW